MRFFQRLRGKMTLTYTMVTGGVFLLLWLCLTSIILILDAVPDGSLASPAVFDDVLNDIEPYLQTNDVAGLRTYLDLWVSGSTLTISNDSQTLTIVYTDLQYVAVIDADARILAVEPQALPLNSSLADHLPPELLAEATSAHRDRESIFGIEGAYGDVPAVYNLLPAAEGHSLLLVFASEGPDRTLPDEVITVTFVISISLLCGVSAMGTVFGWLASQRLLSRLTHVEETVSAWSEGDLAPMVCDSAQDELGELGRDLNNMARQLDGLMTTRSDLAAFEERNRLARDLHDTVKQQVFAASMQLASARSVIHEQPNLADSILAQVETLVDDVQTELVGLIHALRPPALADQGLLAALSDYADAWSERTGVNIEVVAQAEGRTPLAVEQALYRVLQEALANVEKHAQATQVSVMLSWQAKSLTMDVRDNGIGFDTRRPTAGFGLSSMNDRLAPLNGLVTVESHPGEGTRVTALVELSND
ncbi:MAG: HAMP domain-containing sensor histidine kinase [Chloroflexi bacterium]|nr:HAMP domain-containing sensor histidine kinase [Chloroflexota bacterium]